MDEIACGAAERAMFRGIGGGVDPHRQHPVAPITQQLAGQLVEGSVFACGGGIPIRTERRQCQGHAAGGDGVEKSAARNGLMGFQVHDVFPKRVIETGKRDDERAGLSISAARALPPLSGISDAWKPRREGIIVRRLQRRLSAIIRK